MNVELWRHLFNSAQIDEKKIINDSVNVKEDRCNSLLTTCRRGRILEDPVVTLVYKVHLVVSMLRVVRQVPRWHIVRLDFVRFAS